MTDKTKILKFDDIVKADDTKRELVEVPEWDGSVYVKAMTGIERDKFENYVTKKKKNVEGVMAYLCAIAMCDEDGKPIVTLNQVNDLNKKSVSALTRVFEAASRLNSLTDKDVEDLAKNSDSAHEE